MAEKTPYKATTQEQHLFPKYLKRWVETHLRIQDPKSALGRA